MKKHLTWALFPWICAAAPACVLQTESVGGSGWTELADAPGSVTIDGQVGIGTDAPAVDLDVAGDVMAEHYFVNASTSLTSEPTTGGLSIRSNNFETLSLHPDGSAFVATSLSVAGACYAGCASDARLKKNVAPLSDALERLLRLRGVTFEWKDPSAHGERDRGVQTGFLAQEVEGVFPGWVAEGPDGHRRLLIRGFEALSVEAFRALADRGADLARRVRALESANARLAAELRARDERDARREAVADGGDPRREAVADGGDPRWKALVDDLAAERKARAALESRLAALESSLRAAPGAEGPSSRPK